MSDVSEEPRPHEPPDAVEASSLLPLFALGVLAVGGGVWLVITGTSLAHAVLAALLLPVGFLAATEGPPGRRSALAVVLAVLGPGLMITRAGTGFWQELEQAHRAEERAREEREREADAPRRAAQRRDELRARAPEIEGELRARIARGEFRAAEEQWALLQEAGRLPADAGALRTLLDREARHEAAVRFASELKAPDPLSLALAWRGLRRVPPDSPFRARAVEQAARLEKLRAALVAGDRTLEGAAGLWHWMRVAWPRGTIAFMGAGEETYTTYDRRARPKPSPPPYGRRRHRQRTSDLFTGGMETVEVKRTRRIRVAVPGPSEDVDLTSGTSTPLADGSGEPGSLLAILRGAGLRRASLDQQPAEELEPPGGRQDALALMGLDRPFRLPAP